MKRLILLLSVAGMMSSCVSAFSVPSHPRKKVTVVTTVSPRHRHKVVKKVVIGTRVRVLPPRTVVIKYHSVPFIYASGIFYQQVSSSEYEVVKPEIGMIIPELPQYNVQHVCIEGEDLFLFEGTLYKQIPTPQGVQYKVSGFLEQ